MGTAILIFQGLSTLALLISLVYAVVRPTFAKSHYFNFLMIVVAFYAIGYMLELIAPNFEAALTARRVQLIGSPYVGPVFYMFVRSFFGRDLRNKKVKFILYAVPVITLCFSQTWPLHNLYYRSLTFETAAPLSHLASVPGPAYYAGMAFTFITYLLGFVTIIQELIQPKTTPRNKTIWILIIALVPGLAGASFVTRVFGSIDLFSGFLSISCVLYLYMTLKLRFADWTRFARERVLENIGDAFVLVDNENRLLDCNVLAQKYFPRLRTLAKGELISGVEGFPVPDRFMEERQTSEFDLTVDGETIYVRASTSAVQYKKEIVCTCIMLYDITETYQLMQELNQMATKDALTGLLNRGTLLNMVEQNFMLARRARTPAALLMMDIDYFKQVNDKYGHVCGDEVLKTISKTIQDSLRKTDLVGRYGGEEICVYLPQTDGAGAKLVADTLREAVGHIEHKYESKTFEVTISIGYAMLDAGHHKKLEDLISEADGALYTAKKTGRNKVCRA